MEFIQFQAGVSFELEISSCKGSWVEVSDVYSLYQCSLI